MTHRSRMTSWMARLLLAAARSPKRVKTHCEFRHRSDARQDASVYVVITQESGQRNGNGRSVDRFRGKGPVPGGVCARFAGWRMLGWARRRVCEGVCHVGVVDCELRN